MDAKIVLILALTGILDATFTDEKIKAVAQKCCVQKEQCCEEIIRFGAPLRCGYERDSEIPKIVYKCLQKELFEEEQQRVELDDVHCCRVFGKDSFDPRGRCEMMCKMAMEAPSLGEAAKLERIQKCTVVENPKYQCFTHCRALRREGMKIEVMRPDEYCSTNTTSTSLQNPKKIKNPKLHRRWL